MASRSQPPTIQRIDERLRNAARRYPVMLPWTIGLAFLSLGYWAIFAMDPWRDNLAIFETVLLNIATAWIVGLAFAAGMRRVLPRLGPMLLLLFHLVASAAFSMGWYLVDITVQGWADGSLVNGAQIRPFRGPAFLWQYFQGFALYGALAGLVHAALVKPAPATPGPSRTGGLAERMLLRSGDEMVTLDATEIVAIVAADDYSEVRTARGNHLVRKRLAEFENELPGNFLRVHRSAIVNLDRVVRCEPAGSGRITVHLAGSDAVIASKAGARAIRERTL